MPTISRHTTSVSQSRPPHTNTYRLRKVIVGIIGIVDSLLVDIDQGVSVQHLTAISSQHLREDESMQVLCPSARWESNC